MSFMCITGTNTTAGYYFIFRPERHGYNDDLYLRDASVRRRRQPDIEDVEKAENEWEAR